MTRLVVDDYYHDEEAMINAYSDAVNLELKDLEAAGADIIQLDEPYLESNAKEAKVKPLMELCVPRLFIFALAMRT